MSSFAAAAGAGDDRCFDHHHRKRVSQKKTILSFQTIAVGQVKDMG